MKHVICIILGLWLAAGSARAADGDQPVDEWVTGMLRRIPFVMGSVDRKEFQTVADGYLEGLIAHYRTLNEGPRIRAERAGDTRRVRLIDLRTEKLIQDARTYVRDTEAGMMKTLDPDETGGIDRKAARRILTALASHADINADGILDRYEAAIAEAAFAKGRDLGQPGEIRKLMSEFDRSPVAWQ